MVFKVVLNEDVCPGAGFAAGALSVSSGRGIQPLEALLGMKPTQHFVHVEGRWANNREALGSLVLTAPRPSGLWEGFSSSSREVSRSAVNVQGPRAAEHGVPRALAGLAVFLV